MRYQYRVHISHLETEPCKGGSLKPSCDQLQHKDIISMERNGRLCHFFRCCRSGHVEDTVSLGHGSCAQFYPSTLSQPSYCTKTGCLLLHVGNEQLAWKTLLAPPVDFRPASACACNLH